MDDLSQEKEIEGRTTNDVWSRSAQRYKRMNNKLAQQKTYEKGRVQKEKSTNKAVTRGRYITRNSKGKQGTSKKRKEETP